MPKPNTNQQFAPSNSEIANSEPKKSAQLQPTHSDLAEKDSFASNLGADASIPGVASPEAQTASPRADPDHPRIGTSPSARPPKPRTETRRPPSRRASARPLLPRKRQAANARKSKYQRISNRASQQRQRRAPEIMQPMSGVLSYGNPELDLHQSGFHKNCYGFFTMEIGAKNYGHYADIRQAMVRIINILRLYYDGLEPIWLRDFVDEADLTIGELRSMHHELDLAEILDVSPITRHPSADLSEKQLLSLIRETLKLNFRQHTLNIETGSCSAQTECSEDDIATATNRAFENRECWRTLPLSDRLLSARCPGWSKRTDLKRARAKGDKFTRLIQKASIIA